MPRKAKKNADAEPTAAPSAAAELNTQATGAAEPAVTALPKPKAPRKPRAKKSAASSES